MQTMGTASFQFLAFALVAAVVYNLFASLPWRQAVLLTANACFLYTFIGTFLTIVPFLGFVLLGYAGVRMVQGRAGKRVYVLCLVLVIGVFVWLKKYTFLPSGTFLPFGYVTIGLSYILFRVLHLMIDAHANCLPEKVSLVSYLNYTLNFMTLVSGPIQLYEEFANTGRAAVRPPLTIIAAGEGLHRIVVGFFKVSVLSWMLLGLHKNMLEALGQGQAFPARVFTTAAISISYTFFLYFNFSGYIDIVIGIGRYFGFRLPENFDRPFSSDNFIVFWSRWHITLTNWLKTYFFNPLLLTAMRRNTSPSLDPLLVVPALFMTFFLVGAWHGQTSEFLFFGFLLGFGVAANQLYQILLRKQLAPQRYKALASNVVYIAFCRGLTFTWLTFALFWFWSNWAQMREIVMTLGVRGVILSFLAILLPATVLLSTFEIIRNWALALRWKGFQVVLSPYTLTVFDTGLAVVSFVVVILSRSATPDIVYKAF
jgi:D-alanyl-lipoteichoic acid acyltransferase DltB (MBOAT superfamily)